MALGNTKSCGKYDTAIRDVFKFDASWYNVDCEELHHAFCERVEAEVSAEINLDKFKLYRITSILPGTYTLNFAGTIDADNTYNLRVWGATYMSLGSKLFHMADTEWFSDNDDDSRLVSFNACPPILKIILFSKEICQRTSFCKFKAGVSVLSLDNAFE